MTRALVCGDRLAVVARTLGLDLVSDHADLVLVDLADAAAVAAAVQVDPLTPRVVVAGPEQLALLGALGRGVFQVTDSAEAAAIGPIVARLAPARAPRATRLIVVTGVVGGCGRTLLAVNLALRLATRGTVALVDLTGSGSAAWWLRAAASPWSEIESLIDELTPEHLAVLASERDGVRLVGGPGAVPSERLASAAMRAALGLADVVIVDAPLYWDERTRAARDLGDRVLLVAPYDRASCAALELIPAAGSWIVSSRAQQDGLAGHSVVRSLPDDVGAVRSAADGDGSVGGALGRAYDDLAELLAIDATEP